MGCRNMFFLTVHENGTLWDSLYMFNTVLKVMYLSHAMCHVTSAALILILSSTHLLESSWICVSFIKHKIRKTVYPILCRFRKKVSFDLFGWTACWSKVSKPTCLPEFVFILRSCSQREQVNKAKMNYHRSRRNWSLSQIFGGTFVFRVMQGGRLSGRRLFSRTYLHFFCS